jgi:FkbM family methyltransferase
VVVFSRVLKVVLTLLVLAIAAMLYPPIRLSALVVVGRSPACPMGQAVKSEEFQRRKMQLKDQILAGSKVIAGDDHLEQWQTPKGTFWVEKESRYGLPFHLAEQQLRIYGNQNHWIQPGDVVLDCGANIGVFTREALNAGASKVIAIEPAPENLECLRRNLAPEIAAGKVIVYPKGVWDKDDWLQLHIHHDNAAADSFVIQSGKSTETAEKLPLTTIDKMVAELKLDRVDFIKMDIEGAEPKALVGGKATLAKYHPKLSISVYHAPDHPETVPRLIRDAWPGYAMECGPCAVVGNATIRPDVFYFH